MLNQKLMGKVGEDKTYVEDVFSTYLYTGTGSTQTINNGIDLAGKGGLVWIKSRSQSANNVLVDTPRGSYANLSSNLTSQSRGANTVTAFSSAGFTVANDTSDATFQNTTGVSGQTYASWTFRKAPKFFDVVTFTYDPAVGYPGKTVAHNLGATPGMIIVKSTTLGTGGGASWYVGHRATATPFVDTLFLSSTAAASAGNSNINNVTSTSFNFFGGGTSGVTETYVAYLFAHDTTTDGLIQCGSFTTDGSGNATVNLGWEPQYVLYKRSDSTGGWWINDVMRGMSNQDPANATNTLRAESSAAEVANNACFYPTQTGFTGKNIGTSGTFIYMAIRRPMKVPTDGTKVFAPISYTTANASSQVLSVGFPADTILDRERTTTGNLASKWPMASRLTGNGFLQTTQTAAEITYLDAVNGWAKQNSIDLAGVLVGNGSISAILYAFKRAPGFFDVVCYTSTGSTQTINHNLGVAPELIITKIRNSTGNWNVGTLFGTSAFKFLVLNSTTGAYDGTYNGDWLYSSKPSSTQFNFNYPGVQTFVSYLFASCPGVSKVFSFTGNGTNQTINCGFTNGARLVLIKRTDSTGDWYVWDTARGIVAGSDPHLSLNTTTAEVTSDDTIDPDSTGFIVNQVSATNVNVNGATYIGLAIA